MEIRLSFRELFTAFSVSASPIPVPAPDYPEVGFRLVKDTISSLLGEVQEERDPSADRVLNWQDRLHELLPVLRSQDGPYPLWIKELIQGTAPTEAIESIDYLLKLEEAEAEERVLLPTLGESEAVQHLQKALFIPVGSLTQLAQQLVWITKDILSQATERSPLSEDDQKRCALWWMKQVYPFLLEHFPSEEEKLRHLGLCMIQNREEGLHYLVEWIYEKLSEQYPLEGAVEGEPNPWKGLSDCLFRVTQRKQEEVLGSLYEQMELDKMNESEGSHYASYGEALDREREMFVRSSIDSFSEVTNQWIDQHFQWRCQRWVLHALINHVAVPLARRIARGYSKKILGQLHARVSDRKILDRSTIDLLQKARQWMVGGQERTEREDRKFWQRTFLWIVDEAVEQLLPQEISETQGLVEEWSNRPSSLKGIKQGVAKTINMILDLSKWILTQEIYLFSFFLKKGAVFLSLDKKIGDIVNAQVRDISQDPSIHFKLYNSLSDLVETTRNAEAWPLLYLVPELLQPLYSNAFEDFVTIFYHEMIEIERSDNQDKIIAYLCRCVFPYFYTVLHNQRGLLNQTLLSLMKEANLRVRTDVVVDGGESVASDIGETPEGKAVRARHNFECRLREGIQFIRDCVVNDQAHGLSTPSTTPRTFVNYLCSQLTRREGVRDCSPNIIERFGADDRAEDEEFLEIREPIVVAELRSELFTLVQTIQKQLADLSQNRDWQGSEIEMRVTPLLVSLNDMIEKSLDPQTSESVLCTLVDNLEDLFQYSGLIEWREPIRQRIAERLYNLHRGSMAFYPIKFGIKAVETMIRSEVVEILLEKIGMDGVGTYDRKMHGIACQTVEKGLVYFSQPHCATDMLSKVESLQLFS